MNGAVPEWDKIVPEVPAAPGSVTPQFATDVPTTTFCDDRHVPALPLLITFDAPRESDSANVADLTQNSARV